MDRTHGPAGSWRGDGNQYLNPDQHAQANDVIADVGRSEKRLTEYVREAERENTYGGWLEGLGHRLKGEERLKEKIAEMTRAIASQIRHQAKPCDESLMRSATHSASNRHNYTNGYWDMKRAAWRHASYRMIYSKNHWRDDPEYKGINTRWVTPEGQLFEVQFHTAESYHAKQEVTHGSYERLRSPLTQDDERHELDGRFSGRCAAG